MEVPESIAQLREKIQAPRRSVDTWYGRHVMRFFSIYLTRFFIRWNWTPNQVTLLSLVIGLAGVYFLACGHWAVGLLGLNLWYLFDHVDGEIARYTGKSSLSGYFFDTVVNFFVQPLTFLALGLGLREPIWIMFGFVAMFGCMMLSLIPMCQDCILLQEYRKRGRVPTAVTPVSNGTSGERSFLRRLFAFVHYMTTYPVFLLTLSVACLLFVLPRIVEASFLMNVFLTVYAGAITFVWISQLVYKILSKQLDGTL